jgi:hypothetical protein
VFGFLPLFTHGKAFYTCYCIKKKVIQWAEEIGNHAGGRKCTVSKVCVCHWRSIKAKLFSCLTNTKSFSGTRKWRNPEIDTSDLEYFKDL